MTVLDPVFVVEVVMLSVLLGVGLYVSWTDLRARRVPNALTYALLGVGVLGQAGMVWLHVIPAATAAGLVLVGLAVGLGLTVVGVWGPGDGKLFWGAVVSLPPTLYGSRAWLSLDSGWVALLMNGFLCYLAVLLILPFWREEGGRVSTTVPAGTGEYLRVLAAHAAILGLAVACALLVLGRPLTYLEGFVAMMLGYRLLEWGLPRPRWQVVIVPGVAALAYAGIAVGHSSAYMWLPAAGWMAELAYRRVRRWHHRVVLHEVPLASLAAGDVLQKLEGDQDDWLANVPVGRPLKQRDVEAVRRLISGGEVGDDEVAMVEQTLPAAPFVLAGCLVTAVLGGSVVKGIAALVLWLGA